MNRIFAALETVLLKGERLTPDLNGRSGTTQFADAIMREIERLDCRRDSP